jgi:hypothetical protein
MDTVQVWDSSLKVTSEGKPPKMPVGGPAPEWLPGLALALTGAPAGAEGENQGFLTLEELYKTYNEQAERGKLANLWLHFFSQSRLAKVTADITFKE